MTKDMPTLADMMIAMGLDKKVTTPGKEIGRNRADYQRELLSVAYARKFVLDDMMSRFVFDLERGLIKGAYLKGGLRKRLYGIENARMLARLPHPLTFIEMNYRAYLHRAQDVGIKLLRAGPPGRAKEFSIDDKVPKKIGWILREHPRYKTVVIATEVRSSVLVKNAALIHPVSMAWTVDNDRLPIATVQLYPDDPAEDQTSLLVMLNGYQTDKAGWVLTFREEMSAAMAESLGAQPVMTALALWSLLSTINDLPVLIEHIEPSRGFMARGNYRKFLKHSIVRLTVPETRWHKLIMKAATLARRRAHQVRGHWRNDWRHPLTVKCEHVYTSRDGHLICEKCSGRKLHIAEHVRGDASLGFVTHDYEVNKKPFPPV